MTDWIERLPPNPSARCPFATTYRSPSARRTRRSTLAPPAAPQASRKPARSELDRGLHTHECATASRAASHWRGAHGYSRCLSVRRRSRRGATKSSTPHAIPIGQDAFGHVACQAAAREARQSSTRAAGRASSASTWPTASSAHVNALLGIAATHRPTNCVGAEVGSVDCVSSSMLQE